MLQDGALLFITAGYLSLLFLIASFAERQSKAGRSLVANPYVYALSMAVYCTSWTFYGSVGKAATSGLSFLTIYLGPTIMATLWWPVLVKAIKISRENRITTLADFLGSRYGNSISVSALVAVVATVGIIPYMALQIKAIITTLHLLTGGSEGSAAVGWIVIAITALFAVIFGVRRVEITEKHEGLVLAVAFESIVKLAAFLLVGAYVTFYLFNGPGDILGRIQASDEFRHLLDMGSDSPASYVEWASLLFLSMMAIMFLPRQFHMAVVENHDEAHVAKAIWLFPLYLLLINLFVLPVAFGGLLLGNAPDIADTFVLTVPLEQGKSDMAMLVFLGGFSAASGMLIVESLAISNMVMNSIVNPTIYRYSQLTASTTLIATAKRMVIVALFIASYMVAVHIGEFYSLVDMGLKSFMAVTIFAPSFFFGLYWKRGNRYGAVASIVLGFAVWYYTLMLPAFIKAGLFTPGPAFRDLMEHGILAPHALFGLTGLDRWSHTLFWQLLLGVGSYVLISMMTRQGEAEERQALLFVESYSPTLMPEADSVARIQGVLAEFLGSYESLLLVERIIKQHGINAEAPSKADLVKLRHEAKRTLSAVLGASTANIVVEERLTPTTQEKAALMDSIKQMNRTLQYSRQELAETNRRLELLKEFSESIVESLPLGVVTLDEQYYISSWNTAMHDISGISFDNAINRKVQHVLGGLTPMPFAQELKEGDFRCRTQAKQLKGYVSRFAGSPRGFVLIFEDITEKARIEEDLFRATKHASIGRLAAGVSHEIGNPLASISSLVQELLAEDNSTPFTTQSLETINHHINRIARIVRSLGDFARLQPRQHAPTSLAATIENTLSLIRYDRNFKKIEVVTDIQEVPSMQVDTDQIQQVFLNLILNARDAMPDGGKLHISLKHEGGYVEASFADTGVGIPSDMVGQIFDPFFTTKGTRGTGLGLSVSYSIIKDHDGSIEAQPADGGGTKFVIRLPVDG